MPLREKTTGLKRRTTISSADSSSGVGTSPWCNFSRAVCANGSLAGIMAGPMIARNLVNASATAWGPRAREARSRSCVSLLSSANASPCEYLVVDHFAHGIEQLLVQSRAVQREHCVAVWRELVLLAGDEWVFTLQHDAARQLVTRIHLGRTAAPLRFGVQRIGRHGQIASRLAARRHAAVADASSIEGKIGVPILKDRAAMLVSPVPRIEAFATEKGTEAWVLPQLVPLQLEVRVKLVVGEEDNFARASLGEDAFQPCDLFIVDCVILVGH